jgi:protein SCO1/2
MWRRFNIWLFLGIVIVFPLTVFAIVNWYERTVQSLPVLINKEHRIGDFKLINQQGNKSTTEEWRGKIVVANFFFTHCPVICPKMTANLKKLQETFAGNENLMLVSFSVDPQRDSVAELKKYTERFYINESNWQLLTGSKKEIYRLARKSFQVVATDGDGGDNDFIHSDQLILIDSKKRIRGYYEGTEKKEIAQLIRDIKKLEHEN